jgi:hypothetical protein
MCHAILTGALVDVWLQRPVGPRARNLSSAAHGNHAGVQQSTKSPQLHVDTVAVSLIISIDVLPLMLTNWMDHRLVLPTPSRWTTRERRNMKILN